MKIKNSYYIMRHGQAVSNVKNITSNWPEKFYNPLTKKGSAKIKKNAKAFKKGDLDMIFCSPLLRTKQTAEIVAKKLKLKVKVDKRLRELDFGIFNGKPAKELMGSFKSIQERIKKAPIKGESYTDLLKRIWEFFATIEKKNKNKRILIVSHQAPLLLLLGKIKGHSIIDSMDGVVNVTGEKEIVTGQLIKIN